ncbi:MAG: phosphoglycerate dehydrogenase [Candidatus Omnitrophica bacterium]|nr:phosphoglycerate dehydrogenase [Candidatus Omnitrophota bacterium]
MKILISDKLATEGVDILKSVDGFDVDCQFGITPDELKKIIKDYDALIIRSGTNVTEEILACADKLKFIGRAGVGLDNVDLKAATKKGIVAMNTPAGNTTSTAEHTMSMILALSRNIPQAYASMKAGRWDRSKFSGVELYGKTLGVIGLGRIGSTVAKFAQAFGMQVIAYDPFLSLEVANKKGVEAVEFEDLLKRSDYITVHIPKSSDTKNLISEREFALMKKGVRLINCARGGIVDEAALVEALKNEKIKGCALDVFEAEPLDPKSPLLEFDNCVVTPHLGASTSEAQINVAIEIAQTVKDALLGQGIVNAANYPSVDGEAFKILEPYIDLGRRMGLFSGQLINGRTSKISITYSGIMNKYKTAPISFSLVYGLMKPILGDTINSINALDVAKDRGIDVQEIKSNTQEEFVNCIKLEVKSDKETFHAWGTLSGNNQPRIVKIKDIYVEAIPNGCMLFINNNDKPGLIGALGTILAQEGINIAGISLSRESKDGVAISVVNVDSEITEATMEKIKKTADVLFVKQIKV